VEAAAHRQSGECTQEPGEDDPRLKLTWRNDAALSWTILPNMAKGHYQSVRRLICHHVSIGILRLAVWLGLTPCCLCYPREDLFSVGTKEVEAG
jgi:hypothetical protein